MTEEQLKTLEEMRDEIPGFAPSTRKALDDAISELRLYGEMMEKVGHLEWSADEIGMEDATVFGIYREGDGTFEASVDGLLIGRGDSPLEAFEKVKEQTKGA